MPARKTKPDVIEIGVIDMLLVESKIKDDLLFAKFCRKAIHDFAEGCISENVDHFVMNAYKKSLSKMKSLQKRTSKYYCKKKSLQEGMSNTRTDLKNTNTTPSCNKFSEDASIREDEENYTSTSITTASVVPESTTSSETNLRVPENSYRQTFSNSDTRNNLNDCVNDQEPTYRQSASSAEAPRGALPDSDIGNESDESATGSFLAIGGPGNCKSGNSACAKKPYGEFKNVMLTDDEFNKLKYNVYHEDIMVAIGYLDNYLENNPSKTEGKKAYKSHYAILNKQGWGYKRYLEGKTDEQRYNNASSKFISFQERERERTARALRGESIDGRITVNDEDLTEEEFDRLYVK